MDGLQRTVSDISSEISKANIHINYNNNNNQSTAAATELSSLPAITEVEDAKCECCGMSEECTPDYIRRVRSKFSGKLICGLCAEAVDEEMEKMMNNDVIDSDHEVPERRREEALHAHMSACARFNRLGRCYPVLYQAEAVREILKRSRKSTRPREISSASNRKKGGIARSFSCMPAIAKEIGDRTRVT